MREGIAKLRELQQHYSGVRLDDKGKLWNTEIIEALELRNLMVVGEIILTSALNRQESRGSHSREDFPNRDDAQSLKHTLAYYSPVGIDIAYKPVAITMFQPQERKY
jgi:succinate dehydrogenase / fumarate reductase flavoprotein subunit